MMDARHCSTWDDDAARETTVAALNFKDQTSSTPNHAPAATLVVGILQSAPSDRADGEHVAAIAPEMTDLLDALTTTMPLAPPPKAKLVQVGAQVLRVPAGRGVPIGTLLRERRDVATVGEHVLWVG